MNKWIGIGRLTKDPELRYTPMGTAVVTFYLAVQREYKNQDGKYEADFIPVTVWRNLAEHCAKYLQKGRLVAVSGRIQTSFYETEDRQRRYTWEIIANEVQFLDFPKDEQTDGVPQGFTEVSDDEIPF